MTSFVSDDEFGRWDGRSVVEAKAHVLEDVKVAVPDAVAAKAALLDALLAGGEPAVWLTYDERMKRYIVHTTPNPFTGKILGAEFNEPIQRYVAVIS